MLHNPNDCIQENDAVCLLFASAKACCVRADHVYPPPTLGRDSKARFTFTFKSCTTQHMLIQLMHANTLVDIERKLEVKEIRFLLPGFMAKHVMLHNGTAHVEL